MVSLFHLELPHHRRSFSLQLPFCLPQLISLSTATPVNTTIATHRHTHQLSTLHGNEKVQQQLRQKIVFLKLSTE
jgi:hypothetical protein